MFLDEDGQYVFEDGTPVPDQPLAMHSALIGGFVSVALIIVIPLLIGFWAYRNVVDDQIDANEALIQRVNAERIARTKAINEFIYEQCVQAEVRDVVIVSQLRAAMDRARASLPAGSPVLEHQLQVLKDGIAVLEPADEPDCRPPPAIKLKGKP